MDDAPSISVQGDYNICYKTIRAPERTTWAIHPGGTDCGTASCCTPAASERAANSSCTTACNEPVTCLSTLPLFTSPAHLCWAAHFCWAGIAALPGGSAPPCTATGCKLPLGCSVAAAPGGKFPLNMPWPHAAAGGLLKFGCACETEGGCRRAGCCGACGCGRGGEGTAPGAE